MSKKSWKEWHWELLVAMLLVIGTVLGVTVPLHIQSRNEMLQYREEMIGITQELRECVASQNARTDRLYEMFIEQLNKKN